MHLSLHKSAPLSTNTSVQANGIVGKSQKMIAGLMVKLIPIFVIVILALLTVFVLKPLYNSYQEKKAAITKETKEVADLKTKRDTLQSLTTPELLTRLSEARRALPEQKNIPGLITGLAQIVSENNLTIAALQIKPGKIVSTGQEEVVIKLSVLGDVKNLDAMLKRLTQVRRVMTVKKLNGSSALNEGGFITSLEIGVVSLPIPENLLGKSYADPLPDFSDESQKFIDELAGYTVYTELGGAIALPQAPTSSASASATPAASVRPTATASSSATR